MKKLKIIIILSMLFPLTVDGRETVAELIKKHELMRGATPAETFKNYHGFTVPTKDFVNKIDKYCDSKIPECLVNAKKKLAKYKLEFHVVKRTDDDYIDFLKNREKFCKVTAREMCVESSNKRYNSILSSQRVKASFKSLRAAFKRHKEAIKKLGRASIKRHLTNANARMKQRISENTPAMVQRGIALNNKLNADAQSAGINGADISQPEKSQQMNDRITAMGQNFVTESHQRLDKGLAEKLEAVDRATE